MTPFSPKLTKTTAINASKNTAQDWIEYCLDLAEQALPVDVPVGAIVVKNGQIIGKGFNTRERDNNPLGHAELTAIKEASEYLGDWRLNGCQLYVTLEPCPMCASAINQARLSGVYFGASDPVIGACGSRYQLMNPYQANIVGGVLEAECQQRLKTFFKDKRK